MRCRFFRTVTAAAVTAGLLVTGAGPGLAHDTHIVRPGDTLTSIAAQYDGVSSWRQLAEANAGRVADPNLIHVGQELTVATAAAASTPSRAPEPSGTVPLATWERLAACESSNDWSIDTGNGYYGGLQFAPSSWEWVGGQGMPHEASKSEQIARAEMLLERQGWNAWPACSRALGLR